MNPLNIILVIVLLELIIRLCCKVFSILPEEIAKIKFNKWLKIEQDLLFAPRPYYRGDVDSTPVTLNNLGLRDRDVLPKKNGEKRLLCLGDSVVFGKDLPLENTFPKILEQKLRAEYGGNIFVVNGGISGYSTYQWLVFLKKYFPLLCPDIIIVALNINDRRLPKKKCQADTAVYFNYYYKKHRRLFLLRFLNKSYLYLLLKSLSKKIFKIADNLRYNIEIEDLAPRVPEAEYRHNLEEILQFASAHQVKVIFVNLGDAIQRVKPLYESCSLFKQGDYQLAIARAEQVAKSDLRCFKALAYYQLCKIYQALGNPRQANLQAKKAFSEARFEIEVMAGPPIRLDRIYQEIMREVASQNRVPIIEAAEYFSQRPSHYKDFCHLDLDGQRWLAEALSKEITEKGLL